MDVFISWSGERTQKFAATLREWLPNVLRDCGSWMSTHDIAKGARSMEELSTALDACDFAIICLSSDNLNSRWLNFEAGAASRRISGTSTPVATVLIDIAQPDAVGSPLNQFQATLANAEDFYQLVEAINDAGEQPLEDRGRLRHWFDNEWPTLEKAFSDAVVDIVDDVVGDDRVALDDHAPVTSTGSERRTFPDPLEMYPFMFRRCGECPPDERTMKVLGLSLANTWNSLRFWLMRDSTTNWNVQLAGYLGADSHISHWADETRQTLTFIEETAGLPAVVERGITITARGYDFVPAVHGFKLPNGDLLVSVARRWNGRISRRDCPYEFVPAEDRTAGAVAQRELFDSWFEDAFTT